MNGAQLFAKCLVKQEVEYIFGIPGAKIDALFDALLDTPIKIILCHHEQNAVFMAAAYGRITGKPGVVLVTSGPGVSNLITGLLTATTEGDPVVAIGGSVPRSMKLKESHQNTDNLKLTEAATKISFEVIMVENIPEVIHNAFRIAASPRAGATFISMPEDVLKEKTHSKPHRKIPPIVYGSASMTTIQQAAAIIQKAKKPVVLLGLEASRPGNTQAIRGFLKKMHLPVVTTYQGSGVIPRELLDCFGGRVGIFKNQPGDALLDAADLVVTIGYSPVEYGSELWNSQMRPKQLIHIDYEPANIRTTYLPCLELLGDIKTNIQHLAVELPIRKQVANIQQIKEWQQSLKDKVHHDAKLKNPMIHPLRFIADLSAVVTDETMIISDIGTHYIWLARYFYNYRPRHLLFSNGQQALGVALPWAIAAKLARPKSKVISISGDGGFLYSAMELETAVRKRLSFIHCIWCDQSYDMVRQQQLLKYHRESAVRFGKIDYVLLAQSFGAHAFRIKAPNQLLPTLKKAHKLKGPVILEIPIDYSHNRSLFKKVNPQME